MIKTIVYVANPQTVKSLADVTEWGIMNNKVRYCFCNNNQEIYPLERGAHVVTTKGNELYVIETMDHMEEYDGATKKSITGIVSVDYPFGGAPAMTNAKTVVGPFDKLKNMFMPARVNDVRMTLNFDVCVEKNGEWVGIDKNNVLTAYPEEFTFKAPAWIISKKKEDLKVGDIILVNQTYSKVTAIKDGVISSLGYGGANHNTKTINDFLIGQSLVRVVLTINDMSNTTGPNGINPLVMAFLMDKKEGGRDKKDSLKSLLPLMMMGGQGLQGGQFNPMMLLALSENDEENELLPLLLMSQCGQQGNAGQMNPLMLLALSGKGLGNGNTMETLLLAQMMGGNNPFAAVQQPAAPQA